jgi:uncharacterized protein
VKKFFVKRSGQKGKGLFTAQAFKGGELVLTVEGQVREFRAADADETHRYPNWIGIGKHLWIDPEYPYVYLNHSCEPNLGMRTEREFVALHDIAPHEELTFDYSVTEDEEGWDMQCLCGRKTCRGVIRSIQFLPEKVYQKRLPYILPYFQKVRDQSSSVEAMQFKPA